jgi:calcineurin-like phosphoesterase family protein
MNIQYFDFLTADTHFNHFNMITKEDARSSFTSVEEMNEEMIAKWNQYIGRKDIVIHLGDLGFINQSRPGKELENVLSRLKGNKKLIPGNHDSKEVLYSAKQAGFEILKPLEIIRVNRKELYLCHYPIEVGGSSKRFSIHGHIHSNPSNQWNQINVGVEAPDTPVFGKPFSNEDIHRIVHERIYS